MSRVGCDDTFRQLSAVQETAINTSLYRVGTSSRQVVKRAAVSAVDLLRLEPLRFEVSIHLPGRQVAWNRDHQNFPLIFILLLICRMKIFRLPNSTINNVKD